MNILGPIALEYIRELKQRLKGWRIEPYLKINLFIPGMSWGVLWRPPQGTPVTEFFIEKLKSEREQDVKCFLLCRRPKSELRVLALDLEATNTPLCYIDYFRANGWRQNEFKSSSRRCFGNAPQVYEYDPTHLALTVSQFYHYADRPSKKRPMVLYSHVIDLVDPCSLPRVAALSAAVLEKSFSKTYYRRNVQIAIDHYEGEVGVNLDGRNRVLHKYPRGHQNMTHVRLS